MVAYLPELDHASRPRPSRLPSQNDDHKASTPSASSEAVQIGLSEKADPFALSPAESLRPNANSEAGLSSVHIFQDESIAAHWKQVYEASAYESRHRFDPCFEWTVEEERRLVRKLDWRVMCWSWIMFMALDLVRKNISRVVADNFLADLGITLNDYNDGVLVFLFSFLAAELPSGLISKKFGAEKWVPLQIVLWAVISASQAALKNRAGFMVTRALLGLSMGGFIPDQLLYLSYFYTGKELNSRVSWFYTVIGVSQILGSLLAAGFLELRGWHGLEGWRYLFGFEGLMAGVVGLAAFFIMPASPTSTRGRFFFKNGWFTEREEKIIVNRILRDDPSKGDMNNRQGVNAKGLWRALLEKDLWPIYLLGMVSLIPWQPPSAIISLTLVQLGYSTLKANLLAIPGQFFFAVNTVLLSWVSIRFNERAIVSSLSNVWTLPFLVALLCLPTVVNTHYAWVRYALITGITSVPYNHPILVGWVSQNSHSVRNRTVSLCLYNMAVQISSILATRICNDAPFFNIGNRALIALSAWSIVQSLLTKAYYIRRNNHKQQKWTALSPQQQIEYTVTTTDTGTRRLDTRFVH